MKFSLATINVTSTCMFISKIRFFIFKHSFSLGKEVTLIFMLSLLLLVTRHYSFKKIFLNVFGATFHPYQILYMLIYIY